MIRRIRTKIGITLKTEQALFVTTQTLSRLDSASIKHYPATTQAHPRTHQDGRKSLVIKDERTDEELLDAYVAGDHQALSTLLHRYKELHYNIACRRIYGDRELARDGVQEAWITISRKAATFRRESKLSTWMYQIVDRACIDLLRKTQVRPQLADSEISVENRLEVSEDFSDDSVKNIRIYDALAQLPVDQREALTKVVLEGYSVEDAALALGIPAGTIKSRCARGRAALATLLSDLNPHSGDPITSPSRLSNSASSGGGA